MFSKKVTSGMRPSRRRAKPGHKKQFTRTADRTDRMNTSSGRPMRGGIRL